MDVCIASTQGARLKRGDSGQTTKPMVSKDGPKCITGVLKTHSRVLCVSVKNPLEKRCFEACEDESSSKFDRLFSTCAHRSALSSLVCPCAAKLREILTVKLKATMTRRWMRLEARDAFIVCIRDRNNSKPHPSLPLLREDADDSMAGLGRHDRSHNGGAANASHHQPTAERMSV